MSPEKEAARQAAEASSPNGFHLRRVLVVWLVLSLILTPIVYFVWGPNMPPGDLANNAADQQLDNAVLATVATPVVLFVWVFIAYSLIFFRRKSESDDEDGPPIKGHVGLQAGWVGLTTVIVLALFVFGTYKLVVPDGSGTGSGSSPIWTPVGYSAQAKENKLFQVQVIGQQWRWTFRYPQYSGVETTELVIPEGVQIQFNTTSLDVIHSFWAYELGVKADAVPGANNIAFAVANRTGSIAIRCAELCGPLHGAMTSTGHVVSKADFDTWIAGQLTLHAGDIPLLPPYATIYLPQVDGGLYDPGQDPLPPDPTVPTPAS
jgi:cytochrome c oxidase subunit II